MKIGMFCYTSQAILCALKIPHLGKDDGSWISQYIFQRVKDKQSQKHHSQACPGTTTGQRILWTPTGLYSEISGSQTAVEGAAEMVQWEERAAGRTSTPEGAQVNLSTGGVSYTQSVPETRQPQLWLLQNWRKRFHSAEDWGHCLGETQFSRQGGRPGWK